MFTRGEAPLHACYSGAIRTFHAYWMGRPEGIEFVQPWAAISFRFLLSVLLISQYSAGQNEVE